MNRLGVQVPERLTLPVPYDAAWMRWYLEAHAVPGVERYDADGYTRTVLLTGGPALVSLRLGDDVGVGLRLTQQTDRAEAIATVRRLLDLDSDGRAADLALGADPALAVTVAQAPGVRVPGVVDGWELLLRTMVGQQISLAAVRTHLGRLVVSLGRAVGDPAEGWRLMPTAEAVAEHGAEVLTGPGRRVAAVVGAAAAVAGEDLVLEPDSDPVALRRSLIALPGIGPWTADYVVMRLCRDPDVLLSSDLVARQGAAVLGVDLAASARWSPHRSVATMHLWRAALAAR